MRNGRGMLAVYSCAGSNKLLRHIARGEAQAGVDLGDFQGIYTGKGKARELVGVRCTELQRKRDSDPATITKSETEANAFGAAGFIPRFKTVVDEDTNLVERKSTFVDAAMTKVECWPEEHDQKNTVISAGVAFGVFCPWPQLEDRILEFA